MPGNIRIKAWENAFIRTRMTLSELSALIVYTSPFPLIISGSDSPPIAVRELPHFIPIINDEKNPRIEQDMRHKPAARGFLSIAIDYAAIFSS